MNKTGNERKVFVLDTNVLIHDPECVYMFEDNDVVLPCKVIEELDRLKKGTGEIAHSARQVLRLIDGFKDSGNLSKGVELPGGGTLRITTDFGEFSKADDQIIRTALMLQNNGNGHRNMVSVVSKDTVVRIKASYNDIVSEDYKHDKTTVFRKYGSVINNENYTNSISSARYSLDIDNNIVYKLAGQSKVKTVKRNKGIDGIFPKNIEQECAIDALLDPDIEIVGLTGPAGTGKTLLAIAAGLHQVTKKSPLFEQLLVSRPIIPMGNDVGYLPGSLENKLSPWMQPIFDNLDVIVNTPMEKKDGKIASLYKNHQYLIDSGILNIEALTYIRGRSLPRRYFIVDEAQNLRPIDVKTLVTRCGTGTKIVFTGDLFQIDNPFMDTSSNGLSYLISRFINEENFCYLNLKESVRSRLAEQGGQLL
jgi:PhoH-like ATPase